MLMRMEYGKLMEWMKPMMEAIIANWYWHVFRRVTNHHNVEFLFEQQESQTI